MLCFGIRVEMRSVLMDVAAIVSVDLDGCKPLHKLVTEGGTRSNISRVGWRCKRLPDRVKMVKI